ncbi:PREDICTED: pollen-specific leucine-rich repeat extensin-like protein 3 [Pygoscelis adeliae]|uniref:pollen-specific leucine-rich repeat extensin-like protein 3 n=1 Tax=Pygoscelis adeliae TaxID=9238 RepID=UPI0004F4F2B2|nr:PREDICTED: pollen-specific leucine-rich repeat extensin-like protein 3 [Pygoscelis adeliae]
MLPQLALAHLNSLPPRLSPPLALLHLFPTHVLTLTLFALPHSHTPHYSTPSFSLLHACSSTHSPPPPPLPLTPPLAPLLSPPHSPPHSTHTPLTPLHRVRAHTHSSIRTYSSTHTRSHPRSPGRSHPPLLYSPARPHSR